MPKSFLDLLEEIAGAEADFVIVGGVAAALHGNDRVTFDLDIVPRLEPDAWGAVVDRLWTLGSRPRIPETREAIRSVENVRRWRSEKGMRALSFRSPDGSVEVDLLVGESDRFPDLKRRARRIAHRGRDYYVASIEDLIEMKRRAGRPRDLLDVERLEEIRRRGGAAEG